MYTVKYNAYIQTHAEKTGVEWPNLLAPLIEQVSFKKEVGVMVIDLVFWLTVCLILKMCY